MRNWPVDKPRYFIKSLAKGLAALEAISEAGGLLTLSDIADALQIDNTTATRLCYTLTELGFLQRDGNKRYAPTPKVLLLGYSAVSRSGWYEIARYYLESLFVDVQETVNLAVPQGAEILYVITIRKDEYLPFDVRVGTKLPTHCTAMGKVLMAMGPPQDVRATLEKLEFKPLTSHTITGLDRFVAELDEVRSRGYAVNDEELSLGNRAVAAPVMGENGYAAAAVSIAAQAIRYSRAEIESTLAPKIVKTAREISEALAQMHVVPGSG
jgi:IclR family pca regulon transcriptional regulator